MTQTTRTDKLTNLEWIGLIMSTIDFTNLRLLAVFATVVELGSFAAAARKLNTSRSRVSEQIASLETVLAVRLLQRSTRKLTVTSEGRNVYEQAQLLPDILQKVESITHTEIPSGRVAITMNHDTAHKYILPVLADFQAQYPEVYLDFILSDDTLDFIDDQIDLGIRIGTTIDDSLIARPLHEEKLALFASSSYLAQAGTPVTVEDLENCRWVTLMQTNFNDSLRLWENGAPLEIRPKDFYRCNAPLMMQQMVANGMGICALFPSMVQQEVNNKQLINVMPSVRSDTLTLALVYPSRRQIPQRTRVVIDYLLAADMFTLKEP